MYQVYSDELYHHGIKGQKWGVRRFQNEDGSVTAAGAKRYYAHNGSEKWDKKADKARQKAENARSERARNKYLAKADNYDKSARAWENSKNRYDVGGYTASNGVKVAGARNGAIGVGRKLISSRLAENMNANNYRSHMTRKHANTLTNRLETEKGEMRIRKESAALREYNAKIKDARKGTGTKYLDKAIKKNRIDDAFEKVQSASSNLDRAIFSNKTRRLAAKYMVKNNMPMKDAVKKSRKVALASTAAALAIVGMANFAMYKQ